MEKVFLWILEKGQMASYVILVVIAVRFLLKKAPKIFSYALWGIVLFRLICPLTIESPMSVFSILPQQNIAKVSIAESTTKSTAERQQTVSSEISMQEPDFMGEDDAKTGSEGLSYSGEVLTDGGSVTPFRVIKIAGLVWLFGIFLLFAYSILSLRKLHHKLLASQWLGNNLYQSDCIETAFVYGIVRPRIYLPGGLSQQAKECVLRHERTHIRRRDYLVKPIAWIIACIYWFHPLVWLAFFLMSEDMELSCDESVIHTMGNGIKQEYSSTLLQLSVGRRIIGGCPLAFGENHTKGRIKNVLSYRRPAFWMVFAAIIVVILTCAVLLTNPRNEQTTKEVPKETPAVTDMVEAPTLEESAKQNAATEKTDQQTTAVSTVAKRLDQCFEQLQKGTLTSSNPKDYIEQNPEVFEDILSYGINTPLYCFELFEQGGQDDLKGQLMMLACRAGMAEPQNDLGYKSGQLWYDSFKAKALELRDSISMDELEKYYQTSYLLLEFLDGSLPSVAEGLILPDYTYQGIDETLKLVYETESERYLQRQRKVDDGFLVMAVHIHGTYEEENLYKVFATIYDASYRLYGNRIEEVSGSVIPVAITYRIEQNGEYVLENYEQASDGGDFESSIKNFCTMPVSGHKIAGLAKRIGAHYRDYSELLELQESNLREHLAQYGIESYYME